MTLNQFRLDSGTQGTTITTTNTGAYLVNLGTGTGIFDSGVAAHGGLGIKLTSGAGNLCVAGFAATSANTKMATSFVLTLPAANDTNTIQFIQFRDAATNRILGVSINGSSQVNPGRMVVTDAGNTNNTLCSAGGFTFGHQYRFEFVLTGGSTTASTINVKMFDESTGTQVGNTVTSTTANLTTAAIYGVVLGIINTNNSAGVAVGVDDVQLNDGASTAPAPMTNVVVTLTGDVNITGNQVLIQVVASGGTSPYTYSITQTAGPTTAAQNLGGGQFLVQQSATAELDYSVAMSDANSNTGSVAVAVSQVPPTTASNWPKAPSGSLPTSTWT